MGFIHGRWPAWLRLALLLAVLACAPARAQFTDIRGSVVRFATVEEGRRALGADDEWAAITSPFHRAAVSGLPSPVSKEAFLASQAAAAVAWPEDEQARWQRALAELAPSLNAFGPLLPPEVLLVATNGRDQADAPYTRQRAVMLPLKVAMPGYSDAELLAHELFHVISRHQPALASRLYGLIGFRPVAPLRFPEEWLPARIANPDAPHDRHAMTVAVDGRELTLMPVLVAARTTLDAARGETFFDVMELRLLEVSVVAGSPTQAVRRDGQPVWHAPQAALGYVMRLGGNTVYIIHPEETMADNFAFLLSQRRVRNPGLVQRVGAVLKSPG